ncbi:hypothetical protein D3C74_478860 [compost metagenome]
MHLTRDGQALKRLYRVNGIGHDARFIDMVTEKTRMLIRIFNLAFYILKIA